MNKQQVPNALFVGPKEISASLEGIYKEWNFLPPVATIEDFVDGLKKKTITNDIDVLFFLDALIVNQKWTDNTFEQIVTQMAPFALVNIITYLPEHKDKLVTLINFEKKNHPEIEDGPIYFVDPKKPRTSIDAAILAYSKDIQAQKTVVDKLLQDSESSLPEFEPTETE